jgi:carbon monoxide dehydrogenase subunit G
LSIACSPRRSPDDKAFADPRTDRRCLQDKEFRVIEAASVETVAATPDEVFDFVADVSKQALWNKDVSNLVQLTEGPPRLGTQMTGEFHRVGRIDTEITVFERPTRLVLASTGAQADMTLEFRFVPEGDGTSMTVSGAVSLKGGLRFMEGALRGQVSAQYAERAKAIKAALAG